MTILRINNMTIVSINIMINMLIVKFNNMSCVSLNIPKCITFTKMNIVSLKVWTLGITSVAVMSLILRKTYSLKCSSKFQNAALVIFSCGRNSITLSVCLSVLHKLVREECVGCPQLSQRSGHY